MINKITFDDNIIMSSIYHGQNMYTNHDCDRVKFVSIVNKEIFGNIIIEDSCTVIITKEPGSICAYKGHNNSIVFNLPSYNLYDINISITNKTMLVGISTIITEERLIKESVLWIKNNGNSNNMDTILTKMEDENND